MLQYKKRLTHILDKLASQDKYINDWWLKEYFSEKNPEMILKINEYNELLEIIDYQSWDIFEQKLLSKFSDENPKRGKNGFFNTLNEIYAYHYLLEKKYDNIRFTEESNCKSTPDLIFSCESKEYGCEVKTYTTSDKQLNIYEEADVVDTYELYSCLNDGFYNGVKEHISKANSQIKNNGIIVLIIDFDDFTLQYIEKYIFDIKEWLNLNYKNDSVVIFTLNNLKPIIEHNIKY